MKGGKFSSGSRLTSSCSPSNSLLGPSEGRRHKWYRRRCRSLWGFDCCNRCLLDIISPACLSAWQPCSWQGAWCGRLLLGWGLTIWLYQLPPAPCTASCALHHPAHAWHPKATLQGQIGFTLPTGPYKQPKGTEDATLDGEHLWVLGRYTVQCT